jgi:benzoyl-CoA reductase/2-hydroxyglutaryl-CoA dehydratase subunit BcrC/BadD/HgdB
MKDTPRKISLTDWDKRTESAKAGSPCERIYGGRLGRHVDDGDVRLTRLQFDNSPASLRLWNLLLTEEDRLHAARRAGHKLIGAMKDLGTVPILAYACDNVTAFYPDGAWWTPCIMEFTAASLRAADSIGIDESFCPVRAMLGAFLTGEHFPTPDLIVCSVGATCDDVTAIAQQIEGLGHRVFWWEIPHRRPPEKQEPRVELAAGLFAPLSQVAFVESELSRVRQAIESTAGRAISDAALATSIAKANQLRRLIAELRELCFTAPACPLPALELMIAEMFALHFCSDPIESTAILAGLLEEVRARVQGSVGVLPRENVHVYWVNPVADLRVMNLLEDCGGRICGTEYLIRHALTEIRTDIPPMTALAHAALADPMVGSAHERAAMICRDIRRWDSQAAVISRIPGASHCANEGAIIAEAVRRETGIPVVEIEVPPVSDAMQPSLRSRLEALMEAARRA